MKIQDLIDKLVDARNIDPEAEVDVVGYSTLLIKGKNLEVPIAL